MASPITPVLRAKINDDMFHQLRLGYWLPRDRKIIVLDDPVDNMPDLHVNSELASMVKSK
jgi:hypothetical protein